MPLPATPTAITTDIESEHVHAVYEKIAKHFSGTRYAGWPVVEQFLDRMSKESTNDNIRVRDRNTVWADLGCGNGKYLIEREGGIGIDYSVELVKICHQRGLHHVMRGDATKVPFRSNSMDYAISIAVIHHLSSRERRLQAVSEVLRILRGGSKALIYVWALEQPDKGRGLGQAGDLLVPWQLPKGAEPQAEPSVVQRYYHMFRQGELDQLICEAGGEIVSTGYDRDNWWVELRKVA